MLTPIQKRSFSDAVFEQLRDRILSGEMEAGTALPSERALCEQLGVNRGAVREALKRLAQAQLVSIQHGGATRVQDFREAAGLGLLSSLLFSESTLNLETARSVVEMRSALAPDIARLAALRGGLDCADALDAAAARMETAGDDLEQVQRLSLVFWAALVDGSGNVAYRLAFNTLRDAYLQLLPLLTQVLAVEYEDRAPYRAIASAVRGGDCAEAERLARQIIDAGAAALGPTLDLIASTRGDIE